MDQFQQQLQQGVKWNAQIHGHHITAEQWDLTRIHVTTGPVDRACRHVELVVNGKVVAVLNGRAARALADELNRVGGGERKAGDSNPEHP